MKVILPKGLALTITLFLFSYGFAIPNALACSFFGSPFSWNRWCSSEARKAEEISKLIRALSNPSRQDLIKTIKYRKEIRKELNLRIHQNLIELFPSLKDETHPQKLLAALTAFEVVYRDIYDKNFYSASHQGVMQRIGKEFSLIRNVMTHSKSNSDSFSWWSESYENSSKKDRASIASTSPRSKGHVYSNISPSTSFSTTPNSSPIVKKSRKPFRETSRELLEGEKSESEISIKKVAEFIPSFQMIHVGSVPAELVSMLEIPVGKIANPHKEEFYSESFVILDNVSQEKEVIQESSTESNNSESSNYSEFSPDGLTSMPASQAIDLHIEKNGKGLGYRLQNGQSLSSDSTAKRKAAAERLLEKAFRTKKSQDLKANAFISFKALMHITAFSSFHVEQALGLLDDLKLRTMVENAIHLASIYSLVILENDFGKELLEIGYTAQLEAIAKLDETQIQQRLRHFYGLYKSDKKTPKSISEVFRNAIRRTIQVE